MLSFLKKNPVILLISILASIITLLPILPDGGYGCVKDQCGFIVGTNYKDALWYIAISTVSFQTIPFQMPVFADGLLQGYHFLPNLVTYVLSLVGIPVVFTYYKLLPVIYILLLIVLTIKLGLDRHKNTLYATILLLFVAFGGTLTHIFTFFNHGMISNRNVMSPLFESARALESMQYSFSLIIILAALILIQKVHKVRANYLALSVLLFFSFGTKFYAGIILAVLVMMDALLSMIKTKHYLRFSLTGLAYVLSALLGVLVFYNPFTSSGTGSPFTFSPFATVHHLIEHPDFFYLPDMVLARYYLYEQGWGPRLLAIELFSAVLFVVYYFGLRCLGFIKLGTSLIQRKLSAFDITLFVASISSLVISVLFIQKGDWFNTIQFAAYGAFLMSWPTADLMYDLARKHLMGKVLVVIAAIFMMTSSFTHLQYLTNPSRLVITEPEMQALTYLKDQPDGTVYAPILDSDDLPYVAALSSKQTYINFTNVLENTGIDYKKRLAQVEKLDHIKQAKVDYIYLPKRYKKLPEIQTVIAASSKYENIFVNQAVLIYKKK
ncbi:MAG: hypothetical protein ACEQSA_04395 [Weeksellaceae bacterium]